MPIDVLILYLLFDSHEEDVKYVFKEGINFAHNFTDLLEKAKSEYEYSPPSFSD
jgi:hypothetical protein